MLLFSHNPRSQGAKNLARTMQIKRIKHQNTRFTGRLSPVVINWGSANLPEWAPRCRMINEAEAVYTASNKLLTFAALEEEGVTPRWWTEREQAVKAVEGGATVVCRTMLRASEGRGIVLASEPAAVVAAPLYVEYKKKREEYRVHVVGAEVIDAARKARRHDVAEPNWQVRNHANGFVYARAGFELPEEAANAAIATVQALGLDFGAVDIIYNSHEKKHYVLEVNTAPGLEGQTVDAYARAFKERWR